MSHTLRPKIPKEIPIKVKRMFSKVVRKEGVYHLYRCTVCVREKFGNYPTREELKSVSFSNVWRHHEALHPGVEFVRTRSDAYVQPANAAPKLLKYVAKETFCKVWPREAPLMHLCDYFPPAPFYVEPNPEPIY